jgi:ABC-type transport system involved in multi-copper enzyme maturation permease subunit
MKTFIAVCNYDRRWYARRSIALATTLWSSVLIGALILLKHTMPTRSVSPLLAMGALVQDTLMIAVPFVFIRYAIDLGRSASPQRPRAFVHALPVERRELALAKLFHGFVWAFLVPLLGVMALIFSFALFNSDWPDQAHQLVSLLKRPGFLFGVPLFVLVSLTWIMLLSALIAGRWLVVGAPLLIIGEAIAHNITSWHALTLYLMALKDHPRPTLSVGIDLGLSVLFALSLAVVFVRYHIRRNRTWGLSGAFLVLVGMEGVRALACWYTTRPN